MPSDDNIFKTVWILIRHDNILGLIYIQTVGRSNGVSDLIFLKRNDFYNSQKTTKPEQIFEKVEFEKISAYEKKHAQLSSRQRVNVACLRTVYDP